MSEGPPSARQEMTLWGAASCRDLRETRQARLTEPLSLREVPVRNKRFRDFGLLAVAVAVLGGVAGGVGASIGPPGIAVTGYMLRAQLSPSEVVPAPAAAVPVGASGQFQALLAHAPVYSRPPAGRNLKIVWRLAWRLAFSNLS